MMTPHGPDKQCFEKACNVENLLPERVADGTMVSFSNVKTILCSDAHNHILRSAFQLGVLRRFVKSVSPFNNDDLFGISTLHGSSSYTIQNIGCN
jgi:hypothetical protein